MKNNIIKDIWDIRGMVDEANEKKNKGMFIEAYEKFCDITNQKNYLLTTSTLSMGKSFESDDEMAEDMQTNFGKIAYDFGAVAARLYSKTVKANPFEKQAKSVLEFVWLYRGRMDDVISKLRTLNSSEKEIQRVFGQLKSNINMLVDYSKRMFGRNIETDITDLLTIHQEICEAEQKALKFEGLNF
jgi:predicted transcriptional regulator